MDDLPPSGRAAFEAGNLIAKLDGASDAEALEILRELRDLIAKDRSSLRQLGTRLSNPFPKILYLLPGISKFGSFVWPEDMRQEAISIFEQHAWKYVRTFEDHRKVSAVLAALKSHGGRMTSSQAELAEGFIRVFKGERP